MDTHVLSAIVGLVTALILSKVPHVGNDAATQISTYLVSFVVGWFLPSPAQPPPAATAPQLVAG